VGTAHAPVAFAKPAEVVLPSVDPATKHCRPPMVCSDLRALSAQLFGGGEGISCSPQFVGAEFHAALAVSYSSETEA
jgi:hypothetical protein